MTPKEQAHLDLLSHRCSYYLREAERAGRPKKKGEYRKESIIAWKTYKDAFEAFVWFKNRMSYKYNNVKRWGPDGDPRYDEEGNYHPDRYLGDDYVYVPSAEPRRE